MSDHGLTHVAFAVRDLERSIAFYEKYAGMKVIHERHDQGGGHVAWVSDGTRPFAIVLVQSQTARDPPLGPFGHLGVALLSRDDVDRLAAEARDNGFLRSEPQESGPPVGYWAFLADPDGNTLELSFGQEVEFTVANEAAVSSI